MECPNNLELELVKQNGKTINLPEDYLELSAELGVGTRLNTNDRFHPNHLDIVVMDYDGDEESQAHLINKIYDLGYKLYEEPGDNKQK